MTDYVSTIDYSEAAAVLKSSRHVALVTHRKPDGDAMGSVLALARALVDLEIEATALLMGPIEPALRSIAGQTPIVEVGDELPSDHFDRIVVLDTGAWSQLEPIGPWLERHRDRVLGIDHHARGDDVAPQRIVDVTCASTTEALMPLIDALDCRLTVAIAEALFVGLATDTGWFRFENADAEAFALASRLLAAGVDKARLYRTIEETHRPERLALTARALSSLEFTADGRVAIQSLGLADFAETGGGVQDLTGVVNEPMAIGSVDVAILLTEAEPGLTKISFRAKPAAGGEPACDVNELAQTFGGGGHRFAAGARIAEPLAAARQQILAAIESI